MRGRRPTSAFAAVSGLRWSSGSVTPQPEIGSRATSIAAREVGHVEEETRVAGVVDPRAGADQVAQGVARARDRIALAAVIGGGRLDADAAHLGGLPRLQRAHVGEPEAVHQLHAVLGDHHGGAAGREGAST